MGLAPTDCGHALGAYPFAYHGKPKESEPERRKANSRKRRQRRESSDECRSSGEEEQVYKMNSIEYREETRLELNGLATTPLHATQNENEIWIDGNCPKCGHALPELRGIRWSSSYRPAPPHR